MELEEPAHAGGASGPAAPDSVEAGDRDLRRRPAPTSIWPALAVALFVAAASLALFARSHLRSLYDDAYIDLRYVQSLRAGCGLRFNCDDPPVEGFTSPLYLALLAAGSFVWPDLEALAGVVGVACLGATLIVSLALAHHASLSSAAAGHDGARWETSAVVVATALVLGLDHLILINAVIGLETALACAVATALALAVVARSGAWAGALAVLLTLTRPEGLVFVALLPVLPETRRLRVLAPVAGALVAIALARWLLFHDVVPNTYWAKSGGTVRHLELGLDYLGDVFKDFPAIALAPLALFAPGSRRPVGVLLAGAAVWMAFFLRTGGDTFSYSRLAVPLVPTLTVLGLRGVCAVVSQGVKAHRSLIAGASVALVAGASVIYARGHRLEPLHGFDNVKRWTLVGRYLRANFPGESVATVPIGAIAYFSGAHVIDLVGLTAPAVAKAGRSVPPERLARNWIGHERHNTEWVVAQHPDLIVTSQFRGKPYRSLGETTAGFYADWLLLRGIKEGRLPYALVDAEVSPGLHWEVFRRVDAAEGAAR